MRQEDPVRNVEKSSPCSSVTTLIAELPDGTDGVTPRAKCIQTKFCLWIITVLHCCKSDALCTGCS